MRTGDADRRGRARALLAFALGGLVTAPMLVPSLDLAPAANAGHALAVEPTRLPWSLGGGVLWADDRFLLFGNGGPGDVIAYDPGTDDATGSTAVLAEEMTNVHLAWSGNVAYLFGFEAPGRDVLYSYDPDADAFAPEPGVLPSPRYQLAGVWDPRDRPGQGCAGGCLYVFGGADSAAQSMLREIVRYNPETGVAATLALQLPYNVGRMGAVWDPVRDVAYIIGGQVSWTAGTNEDDILAFDPDAGTITTAALLPTPGYFTQAAWVGDKIYVTSQSWPGVVEFDPAAGTTAFLPGTAPGIGGGRVASDGVANLYSFSGDEIRRYPPVAHPPVAVISATTPAICLNGRGSVPVAGIASFDPDGGAITFRWWSPDDVTYDAGSASRAIASAALGSNRLKLTVGDGTFETTTTGITTVVDADPPTTTATLDGLPGNSPWWRSPVTVTLDGEDACGIALTQHALGAPPFEDGASVTVAADGSHAVLYRSVDLGGNVEATRSVPVQIDQTPPFLMMDRPAEGRVYVMDTELPAEQDAATVTVVVGDMMVGATADDATSGIERLELYVDGMLRAFTNTQPYSFAWAAGAETLGTHELHVVAFDAAGNSAAISRNVTTVPTTEEGIVASANVGPTCRLVLGENQCHDVEEVVNGDPDDAVAVVRDRVNEFLRECEETLSRTICQLLPDELPRGEAEADGGRGRSEEPAAGAKDP